MRQNNKYIRAGELTKREEEGALPCASDYIITNHIGSGSFGEIYRVKHRKTGFVYAMKVFSKRQMLGISLSKFLQIEKKVMINFEHPFLVKMHACF